MTIDITIHHFAKSTEKLSVESARTLVKTAALDSVAWRVPTRVPQQYLSVPKENLFLWTPVPPRVERTLNTCFLPEWDSSLPLTQMSFYPSQIHEFESTDFSETLKVISSLKVISTPRRRFAAELDTNSEASLYKRARLSQTTDNTSFSIFKTIPLPHYLDVPFPSRPPPKAIDQIPDFPIFRCLVPSIRIHPRYVRAAWIIPLRGPGPVQDASGAQPCIASVTSGSDIISWNSSTLSEFWTFLSQQRLSHRLGPLSFGYIHAPSSTEQLEPTSCVEAPRLLEYIKVYHDVKYTMKIRNVIDSFRCNNHSITTANVNRIFKGKKLMLVDEKCKPILLA